MTQKNHQQGITLIETMVAVAILGVTVALMWGGFSQTSKNKTKIEKALKRNQQIYLALYRIQREISMAFISHHSHQNLALQSPRTMLIGKHHMHGDRIDLTSFSHQRLYKDAHESDQNVLSYFIAKHPEKPDMKVLVRREKKRVDDNPLKGGTINILLENVIHFKLQYLDSLKGQWQDTWDTTSATAQLNRLPLQIKVILEMPDMTQQQETQIFATRIWIPIRFAINHTAYKHSL